MRYILYSHNQASERKENVVKEIVRKIKYIYRTVLYFLENHLHPGGPVQFKPVLFKA